MNNASNKKVLFVDDEAANWMPVLQEHLEPLGIKIYSEESAENAVSRIKKDTFDVILLDVWFGQEPNRANKGKDALKAIKRQNPNLPVIMLTATLTDSRELNPADFPGAAYIFAKQQLDLRKYPAGYCELAKQIRFEIEEVSNRLIPLDQRVGFFVGRNEAMKSVAKSILRIAEVDTTILLLGASGTGKSLSARATHSLSSRKDKAFVEINCAAIPQELMESELFGHEKGAFTGATAKKIGKFELANKGTIFLDEIGDMDLALQGKLLLVLDGRTFTRVGGTVNIKVDVRVIAATNQDLQAAIAKKLFREDLYYRLAIFHILMPSLRDRTEDIRDLYTYMVAKKNNALGKAILPDLREDVSVLLHGYEWPGNVREFENAIEFAMLQCNAGVLTADAFKLGLSRSSDDSWHVAELVDRILENKLSWDEIHAKGINRKSEFMKAILKRLMEKKVESGEGITERLLAVSLGTTREVIAQIINKNNLAVFRKDLKAKLSITQKS